MEPQHVFRWKTKSTKTSLIVYLAFYLFVCWFCIASSFLINVRIALIILNIHICPYLSALFWYFKNLVRIILIIKNLVRIILIIIKKLFWNQALEAAGAGELQKEKEREKEKAQVTTILVMLKMKMLMMLMWLTATMSTRRSSWTGRWGSCWRPRGRREGRSRRSSMTWDKNQNIKKQKRQKTKTQIRLERREGR